MSLSPHPTPTPAGQTGLGRRWRASCFTSRSKDLVAGSSSGSFLRIPMTSTEVLCIKTKVGLVVVAVVVVVVVVSSSSNTNMHASTEYASPKMSNNKAQPSMSDGREVEKRTFYLV